MAAIIVGDYLTFSRHRYLRNCSLSNIHDYYGFGLLGGDWQHILDKTSRLAQEAVNDFGGVGPNCAGSTDVFCPRGCLASALLVVAGNNATR
jgi:hypothetical protein